MSKEFWDVSTGAEDWPEQEPEPPFLSSLGKIEWLRDSSGISAKEPQAIKTFRTRTESSNFTSHFEQRKSACSFCISLLL